MKTELTGIGLTAFAFIAGSFSTFISMKEIQDKPIERTCPKQSSDGLILAYATYEGSKLTCTYVPHTRGLVKYVKEES